MPCHQINHEGSNCISLNERAKYLCVPAYQVQHSQRLELWKQLEQLLPVQAIVLQVQHLQAGAYTRSLLSST